MAAWIWDEDPTLDELRDALWAGDRDDEMLHTALTAWFGRREGAHPGTAR